MPEYTAHATSCYDLAKELAMPRGPANSELAAAEGPPITVVARAEALSRDAVLTELRYAISQIERGWNYREIAGDLAIALTAHSAVAPKNDTDPAARGPIEANACTR